MKKKEFSVDGYLDGVQVKVLAPIFAMCQPFAAKQSSFPTMQHFCVCGNQIMATDGITGILLRLPTALPEGTWPAELMSRLMVSFQGDQTVKLVAIGDGQMSIEAGSYKATITTYPVAEFPWVELPAERMVVAPDCMETLKKVRFCCLPEETHSPVMNSIWFDANGTGYATTGARIAWRQSQQKKGTASFGGLVPSRLVDRIAGWGIPTHWTVDAQGKLWLFFSAPERAVFTRLAFGEFPNVSRLISQGLVDTQSATGFYLNDAFTSVVRRILLLSEGEVNTPVRMVLDGQVATLSATGSLKGCTGTVVEQTHVKQIANAKSPVSITVNGKFLLDLAERCNELFVLDGLLAGFAEERIFGYFIALLHD